MLNIYKIVILIISLTLTSYAGDTSASQKESNFNSLEDNITSSLNELLKTSHTRSKSEQKLTLLSSDINENIISLYFDDIIIDENTVIQNLTNPIYATAYYLADKNGIQNPIVKIYIGDRSLDDIVDERYGNIEDNQTTRRVRSVSSKKVVINPGHGYTWNNSYWFLQRPLMENRYREDFGNAVLSTYLYPKLQNSGIKTYSTREIDFHAGTGVSGYEKWQENARQYFKSKGISSTIWNSLPSYSSEDNDIRSRPLYANSLGANVMISIHTNAAGSTARGTQIYISSVENGYKAESQKLAASLIKHLKSEIHSKYDSNWYVSNGIFEANHGENRIATMPSVIIELGFHTNTKDIDALLNHTFRDASMEGIRLGVNEYLGIKSTISSKYIWHKTGTVYTDTQTDAQFGLQNNSNEAIVFNKVGLSLHGMDRKFIRDVQIKSNQVINANSSYESGILDYTAPTEAGNYFLVSKYQDESGQWFDIGFDEIVITQNPNTSPEKPIITGVGSIINPSNSCFGCNKDEAYMQDHQYSPSAVIFQWNHRESVDSCKYLNIVAREVNEDGDITNSNKNLDVSVYTKKWNSNTNNKSYNMTLPITIDHVDNWNTILVSSREPLSQRLNIKASCSSEKTYNESMATNINQDKVASLGGYVWAGNSSIIRRDNPTSTQSDGVRRDVAISSKTDRGLTYFQWQPADNCKSLKLRAVEYDPDTLYPSGNGEYVEVNAVNMKYWASKWDSSNEQNYCDSLPCTLQAPYGASGYYIIKVKTEADTIGSNYISATCQ